LIFIELDRFVKKNIDCGIIWKMLIDVET